MEQKAQFNETVMLIDASFLNFVVNDIKKAFEGMLNRPLQTVDLSELMTYLALDAGVAEGEKQIQVILIYDKDCTKLVNCNPSGLEKELNDTAFKNQFGEFCFNSFQPEDMATLEQLYLESLKVVGEAKTVKRLILVSNNELYGEKVMNSLPEREDMEVIQFRMNEPERQISTHWELLIYPVMQALGIRGDELD